MFVKQLEASKQEVIRKELFEVLSMDLSGEELTEAIENGMDSKLMDLSDVIDVSMFK